MCCEPTHSYRNIHRKGGKKKEEEEVSEMEAFLKGGGSKGKSNGAGGKSKALIHKEIPWVEK